MDLFTENQKKRLYIYLIVLILAIGVALRSYSIDLRVLFVDEAVHYSFIYDLWKAQPYKYTEVLKISYVDTINESIDIYNSFNDSAKKVGNVWNITSFKYKNYLFVPGVINIINDIAQPYYYLKHLINNKAYVYDPVYHGPFQYYLGDLIFNIAKTHSISLLRLPMVLTSIFALFVIFLFREYLGKFGLILTLLLVAFSPGLVYYSNLANYENYIAVFSVLGTGLLLIGVKKRSPWILCLSGIVLLSLMTIKETALVTWFCIVVSTILTYVLLYIAKRPSEWLKTVENIVIDTTNGKYNSSILRYLFPALVCFVSGGVTFALLYSSFGANIAGINDGLTSWMYWGKSGSEGGHVKDFGYYTSLVMEYDFMIVFMFLTGTITTLYTSRNKYKLFISIWALIVWLVYSIIPYKTPWLIINFLIPFAISAGIGWQILFENMSKFWYKTITVFLISLLSFNAIATAYQAKWIDNDKESNRLTYVHPYNEFESEVKALYGLMLSSPDLKRVQITITAPEYWPLPAYLFDWQSLGYFNGIKGRDINLKAPIIINDTRDNPELREYLLESDVNDFVKLGDYPVRPGVSHSIFVKQDLFNRYMKTGYYKTLIYPVDFLLFQEATRN